MAIRRSWQGILGLAISAVFLVWALSGLSLGHVWQELRQARYWYLAPAVLVYFGAVWARTWRWQWLLRPLARIRASQLFPVVVIGYMGNNVYPIRAGELIRAYVLRRNAGVSIAASLATIVVERVFDGLVMLLFVFVALPFAVLPGWLHYTILAATALFGAALLGLMVAALRPSVIQFLYALVRPAIPSRLRPRVERLLELFIEGLGSLCSPRDVAMLFLTSVVIWLTETTKYWILMHGFPFRVSFFVLMLMTAIVNLATTIPSAPGYAGTFDAPGIKTLVTFGVAESTAAGYTLVLHAALWLPITLLGFYYMWRESVSWVDFRTATVQRGATGTG